MFTGSVQEPPERAGSRTDPSVFTATPGRDNGYGTRQRAALGSWV